MAANTGDSRSTRRSLLSLVDRGRLGWVRHGRQGVAWHGEARRGEAGPGEAGEAGGARQGVAGRGAARRGMAGEALVSISIL